MPYREPARRSTRYLRLCLDVLTTPTFCSVPWDTMDGPGCTRICPECTQQVHDVSRMEPVAAEAFLGEHVTERRQRRIAAGVIVLAALSAAVMVLRLFCV